MWAAMILILAQTPAAARAQAAATEATTNYIICASQNADQFALQQDPAETVANAAFGACEDEEYAFRRAQRALNRSELSIESEIDSLRSNERFRILGRIFAARQRQQTANRAPSEP